MASWMVQVVMIPGQVKRVSTSGNFYSLDLVPWKPRTADPQGPLPSAVLFLLR